jgi:hypothetical protein
MGVPCDHCLQPHRLDESYTVPIGLQLSKNKLSYDARDRIRKHRAKKGEQEGGTKWDLVNLRADDQADNSCHRQLASESGNNEEVAVCSQ